MNTRHENTKEHLLEIGRQILSCQGFSSVGLSTLLKEAGVPKGSFYHYFQSKEQFGEALLASYFSQYRSEMDRLFGVQGKDGQSLLLDYFDQWQESYSDCLVIKLGAEVADLSDAMRLTLKKGTDQVIRRLALAIEVAIADGSLPQQDSQLLATNLYQLWLGTGLLGKLNRDQSHMKQAMQLTRQLLART
ncbi:MAG: TetR/AcrR family transcriptional regulator [Oceanospirillales bacterium]|uniref:TetR family transcriptional regulator n=1 Tax=Marinobacterium halophilum TaxID=267374 RepID=A0A2P8F161_9GAMM|nr:TetR/AcrR family transcriptional regulator [Marinobacterium halophilum]MBR9827576.1 TetR/AcrR family transcriptional regulator [Oceanospirillales bacterium]PSL15449.1 TetR family transcriptional regulator [Marinobacterium halophilum]